ncbi:MAG: amino acid permease [Pyrinomonas sp.]|uniref:APC family permease n=1 Tax=Pyrinomonas sp. TaxID=2080306 RepID=UPI0033255E4E
MAVEATERAETAQRNEPQATLSAVDAAAIIIGIVIGAGIFKTPSLVAANVADAQTMLALWAIGGVVSFIGALCYAELVTAYPNAGGDYHYLSRAYGAPVSFLFVWARMVVIQTGSIALLAFVVGDYASQLVSLGARSSAIYAAAVVLILTTLNAAGIHHGRRAQNLLTATEVGGLLLVIGAGLALAAPAATPNNVESQTGAGAIGLAMIFVLLTYGGWNEAAYVSAEVRGARRLVWALFISIGAITMLYLLANFAYWRGLGLSGMASSEVVAADLMRRTLGEWGGRLISLLIALSALTSANATVITGARAAYAVGRDYRLFSPLGRWNQQTATPVNALIVQGAVALALVLFGAMTRDGFTTMVEYTAPVFWFFFLLTGVALFALRFKDAGRARPFAVPFYPVTPLLFCLSSSYMLYASVRYAGLGAAVGVVILVLGLPVWLVARRRVR